MSTTKYFTRFSLLLSIGLMIAGGAVSCKKTPRETAAEPIEKRGSNMSQHRQRDEQRAERYIVQARAAMDEEDFNTARSLIKEMRDSCYLALDARERGLLLLDSIELFAAMKDSTLPDYETRVKFYQKKLEYDKQNPRNHEIKK